MADNAAMIVALRAHGFIAVFGGRAESQRTYTEMLGN